MSTPSATSGHYRSSVSVRPLETKDKSAWRGLFVAYFAFYKVQMTDQILDTTWSWLLDTAEPHEGLVASIDEDLLIGFVHVRPYPKSLVGKIGGYLDDLFVDPSHRGHGVGRMLLGAVERLARARGWCQIRWITADDNYPARTLYDQVGKRTTWITYDIAIA